MSKSEWLEAKEFPNRIFFKLSPPKEKGGRPSYLFLAHHLLTDLPKNLISILSGDEVKTVLVESLQPIKEMEQQQFPMFFHLRQEVAIIKIAQQWKKKITALEDDEEFIAQHLLESKEPIAESSPEKKDSPEDAKKIANAIASLHTTESNDILDFFSDSTLRKKILVAHTLAYVHRNLGKMWQVIVKSFPSQESIDFMFTIRNDGWMKILSNQEAALIAVGWGHGLGPNGLLNQYQKLGYTIESLELAIEPELAASNAKKWGDFLDISYGSASYFHQLIKKLGPADESFPRLTKLQKWRLGLFDLFYIHQIVVDKESRSDLNDAIIELYTQLYQYLHELNTISNPEKWDEQWKIIKPFIVKKMFCYLNYVEKIDLLMNNFEFINPPFLEKLKKHVKEVMNEFCFYLLDTPLEKIDSYTQKIQYHIDFMDKWSQTKINPSSLNEFLDGILLDNWEEMPLQEEKHASQDQQQNPIKYRGSVFAKPGSPSRLIDPQLLKECDAFNFPICKIFYSGPQ